MAEIRLVLVKTPKAVVVPWGCGSQAHTMALGIPYGSVGMSEKAAWERERGKSGHAMAPRLCATGQSRRSKSSPAVQGFAAHPQTWLYQLWLELEGKGLPSPWRNTWRRRVGLFSCSQANSSKTLIKAILVRFIFVPSHDFDKESCWRPLGCCGGRGCRMLNHWHLGDVVPRVLVGT